MTWNYRIVRYKERSGFGLHEIYYDDDGKECGMTAQAIVSGKTRGKVIDVLNTAMYDATYRPTWSAAQQLEAIKIRRRCAGD